MMEERRRDVATGAEKEKKKTNQKKRPRHSGSIEREPNAWPERWRKGGGSLYPLQGRGAKKEGSSLPVVVKKGPVPVRGGGGAVLRHSIREKRKVTVELEKRRKELSLYILP